MNAGSSRSGRSLGTISKSTDVTWYATEGAASWTSAAMKSRVPERASSSIASSSDGALPRAVAPAVWRRPNACCSVAAMTTIDSNRDSSVGTFLFHDSGTPASPPTVRTSRGASFQPEGSSVLSMTTS